MTKIKIDRIHAIKLLNKVPEATIFFWIIKILATTVGETAADFLATTLKLGTLNTTYVTGGLLATVLFFQLKAKKYIPGIYWLCVVLISVFGTLISDYLVDDRGVSLVITTTIFSLAMIGTFAIWFANERTLSIHEIDTRKRESFYWLAILFTFALGTSAGDLIAERLNLGYLKSAALFAIIIAAVTFGHFMIKLNAILAFWLAYVVTRPLGASIGDYLSQETKVGGRGLGTTSTSMIFLSAILVVVVFLSITKIDEIKSKNSVTAIKNNLSS